MGNQLKGSHPEQSDASRLSYIGEPALEELRKFAEGALDRVQSRFEFLDSKASQTIGLIAVVGSILAFALPSTAAKGYVPVVLLAVAAMCLLAAAFFSLLCLSVRLVKEPPTIGQTLRWFHQHNDQNAQLHFSSALVVDLANAEQSHLEACNAKARALLIAQIFQAVGIALLFVYFIVEKLSQLGGLQ